jgi:hypothetical protein
VDVTFVTPLAAVFGLAALAPLAVFVVRQRRLRRIRAVLGLAEPRSRTWLPLAIALAAVPFLLGLAAMQPVIETTRVVPERTDAQAFVALDVSRSMLASERPGAPTRFERARSIALELRPELPELPIGIATFTTGSIPHLFPTTDSTVFTATLEKTLRVNEVPTGGFSGFLTRATSLDAIADVPRLNYFSPSAKKRVLVVLTDGESRELEQDVARAFATQPRIDTIFVHIWSAGEQIYETGIAEEGYSADPRSLTTLEGVASRISGRVLSEDDVGQVAGAVRELVGEGPTVDREHEGGRLALMPYLTLVILVPLGFVFLRRNIWWGWSLRIARHADRAAEAAPGGAKVSEPRGVAQPG